MSKNKKKALGLSTTIFISLIVGAIFGIVLHYVVPESDFKTNVIIEGVLYVCGQGFIRLMQMLVVPLVFCSLVCGSMAIGDTKTLGKVGMKTILFYFSATGNSLTTAWMLAKEWNECELVPLASLNTQEEIIVQANMVGFIITIVTVVFSVYRVIINDYKDIIGE